MGGGCPRAARRDRDGGRRAGRRRNAARRGRRHGRVGPLPDRAARPLLAIDQGRPRSVPIQLRDGGGSATASHVRWTNTVEKAFDGDARSFWLAGDVPAPQWIEVDLGREATLTGIRLLTWQETAGPTDHQVTVRSGTGVQQELARFTDETTDGPVVQVHRPHAAASGFGTPDHDPHDAVVDRVVFVGDPSRPGLTPDPPGRDNAHDARRPHDS